MKQFIFLIITIFALFEGMAQTDTVAANLEEILFETVEEQIVGEEESADFSEQLETILQYQQQKINLNDIPPEVASTLLGFTDYQYYHLQLYIELYGELVTIYELAAIEGFSRVDVERVINKVEVRPSRTGKKFFANFFQHARHTLLLRYGQVLEKQFGYDPSCGNVYVGSPQQLAFKYSFQTSDHLTLGIAGEKDAGEEFFRNSQKQGFDHYSFFVSLKNIGILKHCVIGEYRLNFGQGIVLGTRSTGSRGGGAAAIRRFPTQLRGIASMNENSNFRGIAAVVGNAYYSGTIFYGHRFYDALTETDSLGNKLLNGAFSPTDYHRTNNEIASKNAVRDRVIGGHFQLNRRIFEIGLSALSTTYIMNAPPTKTTPQTAKIGNTIGNIAADYKVILHKTILFGEVGTSISGKEIAWAVLQGGIFDLNPRSKLSVLMRYYDKNYQAPNASAFGASSNCNNEWGIYVAADFVTSRRTTLYLYSDFYRFPWLRYKIDKPSGGTEFGAKFNIDVTKKLSISINYQFQQREKNYPLTEYYQAVKPIDKHRFRCVVASSPTYWLTTKTQFALTTNTLDNMSPQKGVLLFQDINIRIDKWNLGIKTRVALFQTDSYDERIYAYESDLLYVFTINSYYGKGIRYYLVLNYEYAFFDIQLRFSQTYFDDRYVISSGPALIQGQTRSDIKAQLNFHL